MRSPQNPVLRPQPTHHLHHIDIDIPGPLFHTLQPPFPLRSALQQLRQARLTHHLRVQGVLRRLQRHLQNPHSLLHLLRPLGFSILGSGRGGVQHQHGELPDRTHRPAARCRRVVPCQLGREVPYIRAEAVEGFALGVEGGAGGEGEGGDQVGCDGGLEVGEV